MWSLAIRRRLQAEAFPLALKMQQLAQAKSAEVNRSVLKSRDRRVALRSRQIREYIVSFPKQRLPD